MKETEGRGASLEGTAHSGGGFPAPRQPSESGQPVNAIAGEPRSSELSDEGHGGQPMDEPVTGELVASIAGIPGSGTGGTAGPLPPEQRISVPPPSASVPPASASGRTPTRARLALSTPIPLGAVLLAVGVTVAFVGILFVLLYTRMGEVDQRVQTTVEHAETQLTGSVKLLEKDLATVKTEIETMKPRLEDAALRQQVEQTAAIVASIEQRLIQLSEPPTDATTKSQAPAPPPPPDRFR